MKTWSISQKKNLGRRWFSLHRPCAENDSNVDIYLPFYSFCYMPDHRLRNLWTMQSNHSVFMDILLGFLLYKSYLGRSHIEMSFANRKMVFQNEDRFFMRIIKQIYRSETILNTNSNWKSVEVRIF